MRTENRKSHRTPSGFTLIEVVLALSLTVLVLAAIGMAVDFFLKGIQTSRADVEQAQLARALLRQIADDLRGTVRYDPMNVEKILSGTSAVDGSTSDSSNSAGSTGSNLSSISSNLGSVSSNLGSIANSSASSSNKSSSSNSSKSGSTTGSTGQSTDSSDQTSGLPQTIPGLYGTQNQLQVDVSRLPRLDQYDYTTLQIGNSSISDRLSDVKTVTYFVLDSGSAPSGASSGNRRGLVRAELDRAVTAYAADNGGSIDITNDFDPIAPEVAGIEFEYYDGSQWTDTWDTSSQDGLPVAVRITLYIDPSAVRSQPGGAQSARAQQPASGASLDSQGLLSYSLLVQMPASKPSTNLQDWTDSDDSQSSSSQSSGSSTSGSNSGSSSQPSPQSPAQPTGPSPATPSPGPQQPGPQQPGPQQPGPGGATPGKGGGR